MMELHDEGFPPKNMNDFIFLIVVFHFGLVSLQTQAPEAVRLPRILGIRNTSALAAIAVAVARI
jgi:hypothetical protein